MTEPVLRLEPTQVSVEPGGQVSLVVSVFNPGNRVEGYDLDVVSQTSMPWATVTPPTISVYPQQEESAVVTFAPPAGPQTQGGALPFGVRARSQVDETASAVVEGDLDLGTVSGLQAELTPAASAGRWSGRHALRVSNWGNAPARLRVAAQDPDEALGFLVSPQVLEVPLGGKAVARVKVRTRHPVLRGSEQRLPFQITLEPEEPEVIGVARPVTSTPERPVVDGAFKQKPILTRLVVVAAVLLLLLGIGGAAWAWNSRGDAPVAEDDVVNPDVPTGFRSTENESDEQVTLVWDEMEDVDSFRLYYEYPDKPNQLEPLEIGPATAVEAALPADTSMCFRLTAVREEKESDKTEKVCDATEPKGTPEEEPSEAPTPEETVTPDIEDLGEPPPSPSGPGPGGNEPQEFITPLASSPETDPAGQALIESRLAELTGLDIPAQMLPTSDYSVQQLTAVPTDSPSAAPSPQPEALWVAYVDGASYEESKAACDQAWTTLEEAGEARPADACLVSYRILGEAEPPSAEPSGTEGL